MSHDIQAAWAAAEVANILTSIQHSFFGSTGWSIYAGRESGRIWPITDGVICADSTSEQKRIALEFKRPNEGLHGVLTAMGQALSYLEKGYDAAAVVIPNRYTTHTDPGGHIKRVLDATTTDVPVTVYTYDKPDPSILSPFSGKLHCVRNISLPHCRAITTSGTSGSSKVSTLWAHMREGMSHPDAFFRFCQCAKQLSIDENEDFSSLIIPVELDQAVARIGGGKTTIQYLSNTNGDSFSEKVWRMVWFNYYFWNDLIPPFSTTVPYAPNATPTRIIQISGASANIFSGRSDSIKQKLADRLNSGAITIDEAWDEYAQKVHKDAHSYREVIDSGLYHIGFLEEDGRLTELGYKYVDACERIGNANTGIPMEILAAAILQNGQYGALLHYIYQLSDSRFATDSLSFTKLGARGGLIFNDAEYREWLNEELTNSLRLRATSSARAGRTRKPLQAEIGMMRKLGIVHGGLGRESSYGIGVGLRIDWPKVQQLLEYFSKL